MKKQAPLISVCIPVFNTECFLEQCLRSVITQNFEFFEIVVVSDASEGLDEHGRNAKKIIKAMQKECSKFRKNQHLPPVEFKFYQHSENRGLIEVRRTLCYESSGAYILQLDSDDVLEDDALAVLYKTASSENADIVHGTSTAGSFNAEGEFIPSKENLYGQIFYGKLEEREIFTSWIQKSLISSNTWGKLIKRSIFTKAFENIPYTECNLAEDLLLFFFISQFSSSYIGIPEKVYRYRINAGMTSAKKIDNLHKWKMICSSASVFTVISEWIKKNSDKILKEETDRIRFMVRYYLKNNLLQLREAVVPELQEQAHQMLCDYWGQDFVSKVEKSDEMSYNK